MKDLCWKQCRWFAKKWNFPVATSTRLESARSELERSFKIAHPYLSFEEEWSKCFDEVADRRFDPLVGMMADVIGRTE
jgi:hypothetical protein